MSFDSDDRQLFRQLNERYGDEADSDPGSPPPTPLGRRILALFVVLAFALVVLGQALPFLDGDLFRIIYHGRRTWSDPAVRALRPAVVEIVATDAAGRLRRGTGFNMHPEGLIVTNQHLLEGIQTLRVVFAGGEQFTPRRWLHHPEIDLALIPLTGTDGKPLALPWVELAAPAGQEQKQPVTIIGNPGSLARIAVPGEILGTLPQPNTTIPVLEIAAPIIQGNSGSPVFNRSGDVVGVVFASFIHPTDDTQRTLALPAREITSLLSQLPNHLQ